MSKNQEKTLAAITKKLKKSEDITPAEADRVFELFCKGKTDDKFVSLARSLIQTGRTGNFVSAFPLKENFSPFLSLLPWYTKAIRLEIYDGNKKEISDFNRPRDQVKFLVRPKDYVLFFENARWNWHWCTHTGKNIPVSCVAFNDCFARAVIGMAFKAKMSLVLAMGYDETADIYITKEDMEKIKPYMINPRSVFEEMAEQKLLPKETARTLRANKFMFWTNRDLIENIAKFLKNKKRY